MSYYLATYTQSNGERAACYISASTVDATIALYLRSGIYGYTFTLLQDTL